MYNDPMGETTTEGKRGAATRHPASHKQLLSMRKWYSENDQESPSLVQLTSLCERREHEDED